jgi:hypothetical protein
LSVEDAYNHRNNAVYIGSPKLNQQTGLTSDPTDKSVLLENNAYIRIPYTAMNDLSTKNEWTMEFFGKFHAENVGAAPAPITVTNSGASSYLVNGVSNATIAMVRGGLYTIQVNAVGHPFWIQTSAGAYNAANVITSGIINNGAAVGTITFQVPADAPSTLYYVCQNHAVMAGTITVTGTANPYESILGDGEYISNWSNSIATSGFEFFNNSASHGFRLKTVLANSAVVTETVSSNTALSNSSSYHIVSVYDGSDLKYYVNGVLQDTEVVAGTPVSWASSDTTIGGRGSIFTSGAEVTPLTIRSFYVDEFAIYDKALTPENIKDRYIESAMQPLTEFAFLYGNDTSIREIMNDITFADMGRVYIDENDTAKYEHFYRFFESSIDQHANVQTSFSDSTNIISGNYVVSLQCNKVTVPVASIQTSSGAVQQLWIAPDNSSLATTKLTANLTSNANIAYVTTTLDPVYSETGYIKIDSEIIKYISKTATSFIGLERGQFQTTAASHTSNTKVRESRYYDIKFDKAPAYNIKTPFISAIDFERLYLFIK